MDTPRRLVGIDYDAFAKEIFALRKETEASLSKRDYKHLRKIIWINRAFTLFGYATAWIIPNPISAFCISQGIFGRWLIMHHVGHGGYDKVPGTPKRYTSPHFAMGWWRLLHWLDWIYPPAWNHEHNVLHHYNTSEHKDPDLVEDLAVFVRESNFPMWIRYVLVFLAGITWKFTYYAPNTLRALEDCDTSQATPSLIRAGWNNVFDLRVARVRQLWLRCYIPCVLLSYVIVPLLFLPLGKWAVACVLINRLAAEFLTNFHAYMVIGPNHAGEDLYRFDYHFENKGEYAVNQVISSCNFHCGTETIDYMHIWLNYQIEHHLYPRLPMLKYREIQPVVKEICERHNVPYIQESVWIRFKRMVDIMVGKGSMYWLREETAAAGKESVPAQEEHAT